MSNKIVLCRKSNIIKISKKDIDKIVNLTLTNVKRVNFTIGIVLCNNKFIRKYNKEFRNKDTPTNILSFSADSEEDFDNENYLGDIIISLETIKKEAYEQYKSEIDHFTHILIHGILHLCKYDHITKTGQDIMEAKEIEILKILKIRNPYL